MAGAGCEYEPGSLSPRKYVLLISGTMNPPHIGHVRLGLKAAEQLHSLGHMVSAICYLPVHDNYLCNKVVAKQKAAAALSVADQTAFPMTERCALLKGLLEREKSPFISCCHVLDYEHSSGDAALLAESPGYWAPKLSDGYLKTVPTAALIAHFASHSPLMEAGTRLGVVFGVDNLAGMATWNNPAGLLARADLVLVARDMPSVHIQRDPSALLGALRYLVLRTGVPVVHQEVTSPSRTSPRHTSPRHTSPPHLATPHRLTSPHHTSPHITTSHLTRG